MNIENKKIISNIKHTITDKDILILRQWFDFIYDVSHPCFLGADDYTLAKKLGLEVKERDTSGYELLVASSKQKVDDAIHLFCDATINARKMRSNTNKE